MPSQLLLRIAAAAVLSFASLAASAACPVGKQGGGTWCMNGYEWKCEKCGSEQCSIMTGKKCQKDDAEAAVSPLLRPYADQPRVALVTTRR